VITDVPIFIGLRIFPVTVATEVFDEVKVQAPEEFEVGGTKARLATDPRVIFKSTNGPIVGAPPVIVTVVDLVAVAQLKFAAWVATKVTVPRALGVRMFPVIVAMAEFEIE
jgi:hypothetical protein